MYVFTIETCKFLKMLLLPGLWSSSCSYSCRHKTSNTRVLLGAGRHAEREAPGSGRPLCHVAVLYDGGAGCATARTSHRPACYACLRASCATCALRAPAGVHAGQQGAIPAGRLAPRTICSEVLPAHAHDSAPCLLRLCCGLRSKESAAQ
jgi:hypothetical protein